jgi:hypothetical protein
MGNAMDFQQAAVRDRQVPRQSCQPQNQLSFKFLRLLLDDVFAGL